MEFYKEYSSTRIHTSDGRCIYVSAAENLTKEVEANPLWRSETRGYTAEQGCTLILVRWVGLSQTPFKEVEE